MRVLAALSGGVDSAVAAARAVADGHQVTAVHLALSAAPASLRTGARGCCTLEDARDAARVADVLGIPFYVWDFADRCLRCNERLKFTALLERARALGFDRLATGHYARLDGGVLRRAADAGKDQSYVLAGLSDDQLAGALFPCGTSTKAQIRAEAARLGFGVADKRDSHDICFVPDGDTAGFLSGRIGNAPGDIVEAGTGAVLGHHDGTHAFTVGQRRGLNLGRPAPDGRPRYVLEVSPLTRTVAVAPIEALVVRSVTGERPVLRHGDPDPDVPYEAQLRAHGEPLPCRAAIVAGRLAVALERPAYGVAKGQAVVLYRGDAVFAAATVSAARAAPGPGGGSVEWWPKKWSSPTST
jgi:tRNA-specific 2-thiouridylase